MTEAAKRRLFAVVALVAAAAGLGYISMGDLGENLVYYWSPTELREADNAMNATVRLGGMVVPGSVDWDREKAFVTFQITDGTETVDVAVDGNPPQMFKEGIGVVVEGQLAASGTFESDRVMVKHSNEYQAPEGDHSETWKQSVAGAE